MKKLKETNVDVRYIPVAVHSWYIHIFPSNGKRTSKARMVKKWQDDIRWWLEIIRLPEEVLPKKRQIIFTTNKKQQTRPTKQIICK